MMTTITCRLLLAAALLLPATAALAQTGGVTIGAATATDASAALDIVSSSKGVLLPRVPLVTDIATPTAGLLVYQTNSPAGFYHTAGTSTTSNWQRLVGAGTAATDYIQNQTAADQTGGFRVGGNGYVGTGLGVGLTSVIQRLEVNGGIRAASIRVFSTNGGLNQGAHLQWNRSGAFEARLRRLEAGTAQAQR